MTEMAQQETPVSCTYLTYSHLSDQPYIYILLYFNPIHRLLTKCSVGAQS